MKRLIYLIIFSVISIMLTVNTEAKTIVTDGLVSYWTFDHKDIIGNTVTDVWGENNATIVGNPTIVNGHLKDALKFDGIKDYVNLTTLGDFGAKLDFSTVEVWIKTDYNETWTTIFKTIASGCNNSARMIWGIDINRRTVNLEEFRNNPFGAQIIFAENFIQLYLASFFKNKNGCRYSYHRGEFPISDGEWHHLVYTTKPVENDTEQTERALFIDGTLNRISIPFPIGLLIPNNQKKHVPFSEPVYLGAGNNRGKAEGFFNGIIDEVRIYDRPLTEAEIMRNYHSHTGLAVEYTDKLPTVWGALKK